MVHKQLIIYQVINYQNSHCELANYNHMCSTDGRNR